MNNSKQLTKLLFLVVFIDMLGLSLAFPLFAPMILSESLFELPSFILESQLTILLGILLAAYPLAQFIGSPILGSLSDKFGRKPLLLLSLLGTFIGNIITIVAIIFGNFFLLLFARILDGFTGGNLSIVRAIFTDITPKEERAQKFGIIGVAFGLSFLFGPILGGIFSNSEFSSWFSYQTPFIIAGILGIINMLLVVKLLQETHKEDKRILTKVHLGLTAIPEALKMKTIGFLLIIIFFLFLGFSFFTQFFQVYLIDVFSYSSFEIGLLFGYLGIWIMFVQGILLKNIRKFNSEKILLITIVLISLSLGLLLVPTQEVYIFLILPLLAISNGLSRPLITALLANLTPDNSQGKIQGVAQSLEALAIALPPLIAGFLAMYSTSLPIVVACCIAFFTWVLYLLFYKKQHF